MSEARRPAVVIFDADSTLVGLEGIDWLAERRDGAVAARIATLTKEAMAGTRPLEAVYADRLTAVAPTRDEVRALGGAYVRHVAPGAQALVRALHGAGTRVVIVSGGIRSALLPLAAHLGIPPRDVYGVEVRFAEDGTYEDFDRASPLWMQRGKPALVAALALPHPVVAVGDGSTDLSIRTDGAADRFIAFTGFVRRDAVVRGADAHCDTFEALHALLLPRP